MAHRHGTQTQHTDMDTTQYQPQNHKKDFGRYSCNFELFFDVYN